ncbi:MAG TPA: hypothetical protein VHG52_14915 [Thermomicrobiales bacterium]|nr:hypothetical protein [Thermomicrobiales bacterium]
MHDQRFDRLTRGLAAGMSRRGGLRMLVGAGAALLAAARGREVSADHGSLPFGSACYADEQCDQTGVYPSQVICANNGFDYDGPYNCCVIEDGPCNTDEHCCWNLACRGGYCADTFLGSGAPGSLGLGEPCGDPSQCVGFALGTGTCADNAIQPGGVCCAFYGVSCSGGEQCCGSMICGPEGFCTVPYEGFG